MDDSIKLEDTVLRGRVIFLIIPISCDKMDVYKEIIKLSDIIRNNHYLVTIDKDDNQDQITYEEFSKYQNEKNNKFFFIDNIEFFMYYNLETNKNNNLYFLLNINDLNTKIFKMIDQNSPFFLYPVNFCIDINLTYRKVENIITNKQLNLYRKEYLKYMNDDKENNPQYLLNVYYDNAISSLENIGLERCLERTPKFKTILLEIFTNNKKRHLVFLPDNKYGIEPFEIIYNKVNNNTPLYVIKANENYESKMETLTKFNSNNSPAILLTNYKFSGKSVPKNIDMFHITDGGKQEDLILIFDYIKTINKTSIKNRNFEIVNHVSSTIQKILTLDELNENYFNKNFIASVNRYDKLKNVSKKLYLKGSDLMF